MLLRNRSAGVRLGTTLLRRLLPASLLLCGVLGACADAHGPVVKNNDGDPAMQTAGQSGSIELTQGVPWRDPDTGSGLALGEVSNDGGRTQARLSLLGQPGNSGWEPGAVVQDGDIFPLAGRFFELVEATPGAPGRRASAQLRTVADTGGIAAPTTDGRVLIEGGRAKVGGRWLALTEVTPATVRLEHWPIGQARSTLTDEAFTRIELVDGERFEMPSAGYRIVRIQPHAGSLLAFVEFARD